jgi:endonuclease/exonuclease/phosphatase family metal-dependent hydrolase
MEPKRRPVLGLLALFALFICYRVFTVYTVRSGECRPKTVDPHLLRATRTEQGKPVSYPARVGYPEQRQPLVVLTYNIAGHDELLDGDHIAKIAAVINEVHPDIVGLQEVHRKTWQARFHDQAATLERLTGMHTFFGSSYENFGGEFGNAILTRGEMISSVVHPLPSVGEPRTLLESVVRIDGATLSFFVTHLTSWGHYNRTTRNEQLQCLAKHVESSQYPYILVGDLNAPPDAPEIVDFRKVNAAQLCGEDLAPTQKMMNERIDYVFADYGWEARSARVLATGPSDHWPVVTELFWNRGGR